MIARSLGALILLLVALHLTAVGSCTVDARRGRDRRTPLAKTLLMSGRDSAISFCGRTSHGSPNHYDVDILVPRFHTGDMYINMAEDLE